MNQVLVKVMPIIAYTWRLDLKSIISIKSRILVQVNVMYNIHIIRYTGNGVANFWIILNPFDFLYNQLAPIILLDERTEQGPRSTKQGRSR